MNASTDHTFLSGSPTFPVLTLRKFCQHKRHQRALPTSVLPANTTLLLLLLLLCGIPERKLIKTRQLIAVPDKKGRQHVPQGSQNF